MAPLSRGARIGPYEVVEPLGSGGMGEVWKAHDRRLGRDVALKVLFDGPLLDRGPDWYAREGRLLAQLNHPNVAQVYGLEESGGVRALVLEFVPGESLDRVLRHGPLPLESALSITRQIASALESAHERGVIHRDLKPANVMRTPDGSVKVLDFGLAKSYVPAPESGSDPSKATTLASGASGAGLMIGTLAYMSPEQARGHSSGPESDIWGSGCVLFELLSGQRPFQGETSSDTIAAILDRPPDWSLLPPWTPEPVRAVLSRCLEKDRSKRFQSAHELRNALAEIAETPAQVSDQDALTVASPRAGVAEDPAYGRPGSAPRTAGPSLRWGIAREATSLAAGLLLVAGTWWLVKGRLPKKPDLPEAKNLLVLPFRDATGDPATERLGEGIAQTLAVRLSREPGILVIAWHDPSTLSFLEADLAGAARKAGANLVVKGTVQRDARVVRVAWTLASAPAGAVLGGDFVSSTPGELLALEDRVAEQVSSALRLPSQGQDRTAHADPALSAADSQERYLQALGALSRYDRPGNVDEAIGLLSSITGGNRSPLVQAALARAFVLKYAATKEPSWAGKAQAAAAEAAKLGPGSPSVLAAAGQARLQVGRAAEAVDSFRAALALKADSPEALVGLAESLERAGRLEEAGRAWQDAISRRGASWSVLSRAAAFDYRQGRYRPAADLWRRAAGIVPDNPRVQYNLGGALFQLDDLEGAKTAFDRSLAIEPSASAFTNLGTLLYATGRWAEAAKSFEMAVGLGGGQSILLVNWADACRRLPGQKAKSGALYRRAVDAAHAELRIDPEGPDAHLALALSLARLGDAVTARQEQQEALALAPGDPDVLFQCAVVATAGGRKDEALVLLGRAVAAGQSRAGLLREPDFAPLKSDPRFRILAGAPPGTPPATR